ncbi:putative beta-tubulin cofactor d protein [Eutypa lata UCREL1]|uniref:Putative beta-tubulin cofactor d protein n=1 Tax=Eutypa lata (strain UCR-EL1) TaxID=1287681 RepID=M7TC31_EUTLA|nr:putative beta-tubulin cofactor d protein [Eutypa lata UCREL1]
MPRFCKDSHENLHRICTALVNNLKCYQGLDRVVVPTLEVVAFLFHVGLLQCCADLNLKQLCLLVQKAAYKTGNVRKLEACIRVYGGIAAVNRLPLITSTATVTPADQVNSGDTMEMPAELMQKRQAGVAEAKRRLGALMLHPWPRIRSLTVDELWSLLSAAADGEEQQEGEQEGTRQQLQKLLGVDWGKADKTHIKKTVVGELGLEA